ncbi:YggS family pyridoxal phosphate-dependent enzyme [Desulfogranum mediterraneum]|uniref:YggS family pyridoxal phosphate-dependent enzyme n=1 Tax=Desulfogranum mediterraneum TaxID=160661 RepID=UPI00040D4ECB|nr:YggS family pyridoxal phosphate-dependent enzyme [Desulfogranum mediterraneum]
MITTNFQQIRDQIAQCALDCGRDPQTVQLLAVSKRKPIELIKQARLCGQTLFGENYIQEAAEKIPSLPSDINWHFIGHLQSNKAKLAASLFDCIQTVDSLKLATLLAKHATAQNRSISILIQVNIGREEQKAGVAPEEVEGLLTQIRESTSIRVSGLMTIPPLAADPEATRPLFRATRELAESLAAKQLFSDNDNIQLSMGMSGDFPVAIQEGATIIRIGTALFGARE